jgi:predicted XRE-type DNA-binding protein
MTSTLVAKGVINLYKEVDVEVNNFAEIWLDIIGYEGLYQVSSFGRVRSVSRKTSQGHWIKGKVLKQMKCKKGYCRLTLYKDKGKKTKKVHRLVALAHIPNPDKKPEINHKDGLKDHNEATNLEWATAKENTRHSFDKLGKLAPRGEKDGMAKLSNKQVLKIRNLLKQNILKQCKIAEMFGISPSTICDIKAGRTRKYG